MAYSWEYPQPASCHFRLSNRGPDDRHRASAGDAMPVTAVPGESDYPVARPMTCVIRTP